MVTASHYSVTTIKVVVLHIVVCADGFTLNRVAEFEGSCFHTRNAIQWICISSLVAAKIDLCLLCAIALSIICVAESQPVLFASHTASWIDNCRDRPETANIL